MLFLLFSFMVRAQTNCDSHYEINGDKVEFIHGEKHEVVARAVAEHFSPLPPVKSCSENLYGRDQNFAFLNGKMIEGAEAKGFFVETVDDRYTHDEKHAFWKGKEIAQATGKGFRAVAPGYARDPKRAFFENLAIPEANPQELVAAGNGFVRDQTRVYFQTEAFPLGALQLFGSYARLGSKVFYHQVQVPGADAASFTALDDCFARDVNAVFVRASKSDFKPNEVSALEADSAVREACRTKDAEICCARKGANLLAVVQDKKGESRLLDLPWSELEVKPGGILKTKTWTFKKLVEQ